MDVCTILTLILAPVTVGLLLLYLQQLGKVSEARSESETRKKEVDALLGKLERESKAFEDALRAARNHYGEKDSEQRTQIDWCLGFIHSLKGVIRALAVVSERHPSPKGLKTILSGDSEVIKEKEPNQPAPDNEASPRV